MGPEGEQREVKDRESERSERVPSSTFDSNQPPARGEWLSSSSIKELLESDGEEAHFSALVSLRMQPELYKDHKDEILRLIAVDPESRFSLAVLQLFAEKLIHLSDADRVVGRVLERVSNPECLSAAIDLIFDWRDGAQSVRTQLVKLVVGPSQDLGQRALAVLLRHRLVDMSVLEAIFDGLTAGMSSSAESRAVDCIVASSGRPARFFEILTSHVVYGDEIKALVALKVARTLAQRGSWLGACVETLVHGLERSSDMIREESAESLGALGHLAFTASMKLGQALERAPEIGIRYEILSALLSVGGEAIAFEALCRSIMLESELEADNLYQFLLLIKKGATKVDPSALRSIVPLFSHRSEEVQSAAREVFESGNLPLDVCVETLASREARAVEAALGTLAKSRHLKTLPQSELLRTFLTGSDSTLCRATLELLNSFPRLGAELFPAILYVVADPSASEGVRLLALTVAMQRGPLSRGELDRVILCFEAPKTFPDAVATKMAEWISRYDDRALSLASIARWVGDMPEFAVASHDQEAIAYRGAALVREYNRGIFRLAYGLSGLEAAARVLAGSPLGTPSFPMQQALHDVLTGWKARFLRWLR